MDDMKSGMVADAIMQISPGVTPILSRVKRTTAVTQWIEFYTQISTRLAAGSTEETHVQSIQTESLELKKDVEWAICSDAIPFIGPYRGARISGGLAFWITTNRLNQDGEVLTSASLDRLTNMVSPSDNAFLMANTDQISRIAQCPGYAQSEKNGGMYTNGHAYLSVIENRFMPQDRVYLIDPDSVEITYLRPFSIMPLAPKGDAGRTLVLAEWSLRVLEQTKLGMIVGLPHRSELEDRTNAHVAGEDCV